MSIQKDIRTYVLKEGMDDWVCIMWVFDPESYDLPVETAMARLVTQVVGDMVAQGLVEIGTPTDSGFEVWPMAPTEWRKTLEGILSSEDPGYDGYATYLRLTERGKDEAEKVVCHHA